MAEIDQEGLPVGVPEETPPPKPIPVFLVVPLILIGAFLVLVTLSAGPAPAGLTLGECLAEAGVTMYGVDTCQNCVQQKSLFGQDFSNVPYVNCDFQTELCREKGITAYPVWARDDSDSILLGLQSLGDLAEWAECE